MRKAMAKNNRVRLSTEQGAALVTTLMLLLLLTAMSLTMVLSVSSDMLINGYYRNYRSSFYAADSGLNISRQSMVSQILAAVPQKIVPGVAPIPPGYENPNQRKHPN